jgi:hypothetical protein
MVPHRDHVLFGTGGDDGKVFVVHCLTMERTEVVPVGAWSMRFDDDGDGAVVGENTGQVLLLEDVILRQLMRSKLDAYLVRASSKLRGPERWSLTA